jgi:hypothetical protein
MDLWSALKSLVVKRPPQSQTPQAILVQPETTTEATKIDEAILINTLAKISMSLGVGVSLQTQDNGQAMLSTIQDIEQQAAGSTNASLLYALAIAYRNYTAWYVRGDDRKPYLEKVLAFLEKAAVWGHIGAKVELANLLIEERLMRNLERGVQLAEELQAAGSFPPWLETALKKAHRWLGRNLEQPLVNFADLSVMPAVLREERLHCRALIRTYQKTGQTDKLRQVLGELYNLAVFVCALYGMYSGNGGVTGADCDVAEILQKKIGRRIKFSYQEHGRIHDGNFLSATDYRMLVKVFGQTDKSFDPRAFFKKEIDESVRKVGEHEKVKWEAL